MLFSCSSCVWLFMTPWTTVHQASLPLLSARSLLKLRSIESVMPSNHLILCRPFSSCPQSFWASGSFPMNWLFTSGGQSAGVSALASVLPSVSLVAQTIKNLPAMQGLVTGLGRSPGKGNGNPLQYSCLENPHEQRNLEDAVHGVAKSWTWLSN